MGYDDRLHDVRFISSTIVTDFILLIWEHMSQRIVCDVKQITCWASMVDEKTDIAALQLYIVFVQYMHTKECQATEFYDIRRIGDRGATAANLFRL